MKINEEIKVNRLVLKNRLVMPPMATSGCVDGKVSDTLLRYYDEKSAGGYLGVIITEHSYVHVQGKADAGQMSVSQDDDIEGMRKLIDVIHSNGVMVFAQLNHAGSAARNSVTGMPVIGPSALLHPRKKDGTEPLPKEMTKDMIQKTTEDFARAAQRAKLAGYDGVEIHAAHGYLLNQFYSPLTNRRTDEYGFATLENRLRFHKEVIEAVRKAVGKDYPVALRLGGCDYMDGGSTVEDSIEAAVLLERYGIDLLDISGGMNGYVVPGRNEPGYFRDMTAPMKQKLSIPVLLTGGITKIGEAEDLVERGEADLIGVGRAILRDSQWAAKQTQGQQP